MTLEINKNKKKWNEHYIVKVFLGFLMLTAMYYFFKEGFIFLRDAKIPQAIMALVAIIWGVGGTTSIFVVFNWIVENLFPRKMGQKVLPYVFIGPAMLMLLWFLFIPTIRTFYLSLFGPSSDVFVGIKNYLDVFTERAMLEAFRNNLMWIILGTGFCVILGLLVAVLADRSSYEKIAKGIVFMPMAISFVGAGVIWRFVYLFEPIGSTQRGVLNALMVFFGQKPMAWLQTVQPWNNLFLIAVAVWIQTGFAMVVLSSAIKGVPGELLEAARIDGATEVQIFFRIIIPYIKGTLITVTTTIIIFMLKIFDVVLVMTGGNYGTEVIATQFYRQFFTNRNAGLGSAISIVLLVAVIPVMIYNVRQLNKQETFK
jgi:alpha-glucoside transport system permease protein